ncbi:MAG: apolipoprotein N-acyltransferase [Phycisphaerae bacterium]|nr:apolipoprotein N-acyltransferase [Phycisphaerae bacterium]
MGKKSRKRVTTTEKAARGGSLRGAAPGADYRVPIRDRTLNLGLCLATAILLALAFPPVGWWPVAFVALAPMLVAVVRAPSRGVLAISTFLAAVVFYAGELHWLAMPTVPGYVGAVLFCALFWPAFGLLAAYLVRQTRLPLAAVAPMVWVPLELLRSHLLTGFPWLLIGHSQAASPTLLQIVDLTGVYGLSALAAATAGLAVDTVTRPLFLRYGQRMRWSLSLKVSVVALAAAWAFVVVYGHYRLRPVAMADGPLVVVVQPNVPQDIREALIAADAPERPLTLTDEAARARLLEDPAFADLMALTPQALAEHPDADLVVWPETMTPVPVNESLLRFDASASQAEARAWQLQMRTCWRMIHDLVAGSRRRLLVGSQVRELDAGGRYGPRFNRALLFAPDDREFTTAATYDKVHLVPFGEYVPFKESAPWLYGLLMGLTPYDYEYDLTAGEALTRMELGPWRLAAPICFEDAFAGVCRRMVYDPRGDKAADFLVNISNDGWFPGTVELQQHWDLSVVRAVENRVPVVRSVNTGISGVIDSCGRTVVRVSDAAGHVRSVKGYAAARLELDGRRSVYGRYGDVFAVTLSLAACAAMIAAVVAAVRGRRGEAA